MSAEISGGGQGSPGGGSRGGGGGVPRVATVTMMRHTRKTSKAKTSKRLPPWMWNCIAQALGVSVIGSGTVNRFKKPPLAFAMDLLTMGSAISKSYIVV